MCVYVGMYVYKFVWRDVHAVGGSEGLCCCGEHHNSTWKAQMFFAQTKSKSLKKKN